MERLSMNRRIVIPALVIGLALCFAIIALPAEGASGARLQSTQEATVDPCNPKPLIPGTVVADYIAVLSKALDGSPEVLYVRKLDLVSVLARNNSFTWVVVQTNSGLVGWLPSAYVSIDPLLRRKLDVVDGLVAVTQAAPVATDVATDDSASQATATAIASACPNFTGTVTGDLVAVKVGPLTTAKDAGVNVQKSEQVTILGLNGSGSWFHIRTKDGVEGWVTSSFVYVAPAKIASIRHDYSSSEVTLTPSN
jgi:uncharacterized protein YgiM (DUF1202 family)